VFTVGVELGASSSAQTVLNNCATPATATNAIPIPHNLIVVNNADPTSGLVPTVQTLATQIAAATGTGTQTLRTTR